MRSDKIGLVDPEASAKRNASKKTAIIAIVSLCLVASCFAALYSTVSGSSFGRIFGSDNSIEAAPCPIQNFDYLLLAIRWAPSDCHSTKSKCVPKVPQSWLIHGLWPNYWDGSWPQFCCNTDPFNVDNVKSLENDLLAKWANLLKGKSADSLWAHEWDKHGTCSAQSKKLVGEKAYFSSTLNLFATLPVADWFSAANIVPSEDAKYTEAEATAAITKHFPNVVELACQTSEDSKDSVLDTISFCYDKTTLTPIDCPTPKHTCKKGFVYPTSRK
ncbi:Ribonuclease DdI [Halotydeus destructor]|nr:Ribonuclease DdI [Halotydeus destructor]